MRRRLIGVSLFFLLLIIPAVASDELKFFLHSEPKTFSPISVADDSSETIRYLTGGVLVRLNRQTQRADPELATSWKISPDGRTIIFHLRQGVRFPTALPSALRTLNTPSTH